ncbi:MoxR family ATPase [Aggregatilineales bacterium SYSU G02658]
MSRSLREINQHVRQEVTFVRPVVEAVTRVLVGQERLLNRMLVALLADGHILIEGVPGVAKTLAVKTLSAAIDAQFQRIQFTPDLLPSDLTGTLIFNPATTEFTVKRGPIFTNIVLADEINRAPSKVQSALLEAMEERQVTLGDVTYPLPKPFMVLATQNPIEQEGTYSLPEAQLDRFMLKVIVTYPSQADERIIIERMSGERPEPPTPVTSSDAILRARQIVDTVYVDEKVVDYALAIIHATRKPVDAGFKKLDRLIEYGASPRAAIALVRAARAHAVINGRGFVTPDDVKAMTPDVLRHRLVLTFEALADNITSGQIINQILKQVEVP